MGIATAIAPLRTLRVAVDRGNNGPMSEIMSLVCPHVFADERPVRLMVHHGDGTWQAVCGQRDHSEKCADFRVVGVNHLFDRQADLGELETLPPERIAEWIDGRWTISVFDEDGPD